MTVIKLIVGVCGFVLIYGFVGHLDEQAQIIEDERYCEMRKVWEDNKHLMPVERPGWPNFKPEIDCQRA